MEQQKCIEIIIVTTYEFVMVELRGLKMEEKNKLKE